MLAFGRDGPLRNSSMAAVVAGRAMCFSVSSAVTASAMPFAVRGPAMFRVAYVVPWCQWHLTETGSPRECAMTRTQDTIYDIMERVFTVPYVLLSMHERTQCNCCVTFAPATLTQTAVLSEQDRPHSGHTRHASSAANRTLVVLGRLARREDLNGRESLDAVLAARRLVGLRVAVHRHHIDDAVQRLRHLLIRRRQALAVTTPVVTAATSHSSHTRHGNTEMLMWHSKLHAVPATSKPAVDAM